MKNNTINKKEIEKFSKIAEEWWDPNGKFKPLHKFNPVRIEYIKKNILKDFALEGKIKPLDGIKILDVGCGGGLLSEPLSRLGADVTGIDASNRNIEVAKIHARKMNLDIKYYCTSPEKMKNLNKFDVVLNMEIVEHVSDVRLFLKSCTNLLRRNGIMFVATINRTLKSYMFAIIGAEYVLKWLPIGTHDWSKFVKPEEISNILKTNNLKLEKHDGVKFNIISNTWDLSSDTSVNYISKFHKN